MPFSKLFSSKIGKSYILMLELTLKHHTFVFRRDRLAAEVTSEGMSKKILLADDDSDIRFILKTVLDQAGYHVEPLSSGKTLVEGKREWPDLFILDRSLPTIDGLALCKYLKLNAETRNIPIIMMSSYHKLRSKARKIGVDAFIEKPFDLQDLLDLVEKHVRTTNL